MRGGDRNWEDSLEPVDRTLILESCQPAPNSLTGVGGGGWWSREWDIVQQADRRTADVCWSRKVLEISPLIKVTILNWLSGFGSS